MTPLFQLPVGAFRAPHRQKVDWDPLRDFPSTGTSPHLLAK